jgi:hypothetical protein
MEISLLCTNEFRESLTISRSKNLKLNQYKLKKLFVITLGSLLFLNIKVNALPTDQIDKGGSTILTVVRHLGYWGCIIACTLEIIRTVLQGDTKSVGKCIAKYSISYGALYLLPWILDLIKSIFS